MADNLSNSAQAAVYAPDGTVRMVPNSDLQDALKNGGQLAVPMKSPKGDSVWVPTAHVAEAQQQGGKVDWSAVPDENHKGFWSGLGSTLGGFLKPGAQNPYPGMGQEEKTAAAQQSSDADLQRAREGRGMAYRTLAPVAESVGADVQGMESAANRGDTSAVVGHAVGSAIPPVVGAAVAEVAPKAASSVVNGVKDKYYNVTTSAVRATEPAAAGLPPKAAFGVEKVFRAAAPVGSDPMFRTNLYKAAGDLAEIGQKARLDEAKGGIVQPDRRVAATVDAINDHLTEMYQQERQPQIQRNAQNPIEMKLSTDAKEGLTHLARKAATEADRTLAQKALNNEYLTLEETDRLARLTNNEMAPFRDMTPQERAAVSQGNRKYGSLKALDKEIGDKIAGELDRRGEPGIKDYEGRYAALSSVRDQLRKRVNAVELQRSNAASRLIGSVVKGKAGIASASQAAVADVNIGKSLQQGLETLADTGMTANRAVGKGAPPVRGLLGTGSIQLPSSMEPITPPSAPQPVLERPYNPPGVTAETSFPDTGVQASSITPKYGESSGSRSVAVGKSEGLKRISASEAYDYMIKAKGNKIKARELAKQDGKTF